MIRNMRSGRPVSLDSRVSVGMAAHGNSGTTQKALEALFASAQGDFELILVDDASPDDTLEVFIEARKWHGNTRLFSFPSNLEYCRSVDAFLSHARGERLLFLSNDIFVCPAYIRELVLDAPARGAGYGIFRGCSNYVDGNSPLHNVATGAFSAREDFCVFGAEFAHRRRGRGLLDDRYLVGDAFLVTRPVIDSIGTFDPRFFGYCGDLDFGLRAQIAGFRIALVQSAFALHEKHGNIDYLPEQEQADKMARRHARVAQALNVLMRK